MDCSFWPELGRPWDEGLPASRHAAPTGWHATWVSDPSTPPTRTGPVLECFSAMAALAQATERVRIGSLVLGNTYRHPAVVANQAATVDHISHGRAVLGLGAAWQEDEHAAYGIPFPATTERLD